MKLFLHFSLITQERKFFFTFVVFCSKINVSKHGLRAKFPSQFFFASSFHPSFTTYFLALFSSTIPLFSFYVFLTETGKPQIIEKTDNSVTLSWVRSNAIGSSSLLGYTVEMFGRNSTEGWVQTATRVQNTTYQVLGLSIGVSYYFAVRAENSHGMSGPSQLSEPITIGVVSETRTSFTNNYFLVFERSFSLWREDLNFGFELNPF